MRPSCAENSLIFEWLALLRREYRIYNVDNRHQCHVTATHTLRLSTSEEEELLQRKRARQQQQQPQPKPASNIVQPFVWAPQFYGCIECGRYHICKRDERECEMVEYEDQLTCLHSHQVIRQAYGLANYGQEQQLRDEGRDAEEEPRLAGSTRRVVRASRGTQYSNSRMHQPLCVLEALEELEKKEGREEERQEARRLCEKGLIGQDDDHEQEVESMQVEQSNEARLKNWHDNRLYWNEFFGFLFTPATSAPTPSLDTTESEYTTVVFPDPASLMQPLELKPREFVLTEQAATLVADTVYEVVQRLMKAQHKRLGREQPTQIDALNRQIVDCLVPPVQQILALCVHAYPQLGVRNACIALLLIGLCDSHYDADSFRHRIEVWHRQAWLAHLRDSGVTETLFAPPRRKNHRAMDSVKKRQRYDQAQIKLAWAHVERALSRYSGHGLWLRSVILK